VPTEDTKIKTGTTLQDIKEAEYLRKHRKPGTICYVKKPSSMGGNYTYKEKVKVAETYLATGNVSLTSRLVKVPLQTIRHWMEHPWWDELINELIVTKKVEDNKVLRRISEQALNVVTDRLTDGNHQLNQKTGELVRVPVNVRDAHRIAVDLMEQQEVVERRIEELSNRSADNSTDTLNKLAAQFMKIANQTTKKEKTIDIEDVVILDTKETEHVDIGTS